jgi:hypothetical protein
MTFISKSSADSRRQALTIFTSSVSNTRGQSVNYTLSSILHVQTSLQVTDQYNLVAAIVMRMPSFLIGNPTNESEFPPSFWLVCMYLK